MENLKIGAHAKMRTESDSSLQSLSDTQLENSTKEKVRFETEATTTVLHHLAEIQRRRLYAVRGYCSLFDYATKALGYSEGAAYRRINAMKLISSVPEAEEQISSGKLSLSTAATVQSFFTKKNKSDDKPMGLEEKIDILSKVQSKSKRECERSLCSISPLAIPQEKERTLTEDKTEIRFVADKELLEQLEKVKNLVSHKSSSPSYAELFKIMAGDFVKKNSPKTRAKAKTVSNKKLSTQRLVAAKSTPPLSKISSKGSGRKNNRYIPLAYRQELWRRSDGRCEYIDSKTNKRCGCRNFLEVDHIKPIVLGGKTEMENLRLLCREHNLLVASQVLGFELMEKYRTPIIHEERSASSSSNPRTETTFR